MKDIVFKIFQHVPENITSYTFTSYHINRSNVTVLVNINLCFEYNNENLVSFRYY